MVFPSPAVDPTMFESIPVELPESALIAAIIKVIGALNAASSILLLRDRRGIRPIEQQVFDDATGELEAGLRLIHEAGQDDPAKDGVDSIPAMVAIDLARWVEEVASEETGGQQAGSFAQALSDMTKGRNLELQRHVGVMTVLLSLQDVDPDRARHYFALLVDGTA